MVLFKTILNAKRKLTSTNCIEVVTAVTKLHTIHVTIAWTARKVGFNAALRTRIVVQWFLCRRALSFCGK